MMIKVSDSTSNLNPFQGYQNVSININSEIAFIRMRDYSAPCYNCPNTFSLVEIHLKGFSINYNTFSNCMNA